MRIRRRLFPVSGVILAGFAASASAQVTGVAVLPASSGPAPLTVTIQVLGAGACATVMVDFGDGSLQASLSGTFPLSTARHTYAAGTYTVHAYSSLCGGDATTPITAAAGSIAKVSLDPDTAAPGQSVKITVKGSGTCSFRLDTGESTSHPMGADLPEDYHHAYDNAGTYTVKATADAPCTGSDTASLTVVTPKLTSAAPDEFVGPGSYVLFGGKGVKGAQELEINLPGEGHVRRLDHLYSGSTFVGGRIPPDITGIRAGKTSFRVKVGNEWSAFFDNGDRLQFAPATDIAVLDPKDVHVQHCSDDAGSNRCNTVSSGHVNGWEVFSIIVLPHPVGLDSSSAACGGGKSICATHESGWGFEGDEDKDVYSVSLKNGWVVLRTERDKPPLDNGHVTFVNDFDKGASSSTLTVNYDIGATGGAVGYSESVFVIGPKGLPFN